MTYPYDGIHSSIEYYNNYIDYLEKQIKRLRSEKKQYLQLLDMQNNEEIKQKVKKIGEKK